MSEHQPESGVHDASPTADSLHAKSIDYAYTNSDGIKESFASFSSKINELDRQLGKLANDCLKLGRVAGLLLAIKSTRETLRRTREVFFRNATALVPQLHELARRDCNSKARDASAEHYFIPSRYFMEPLPSFDVLPRVLEELAVSFNRLHVRIDEFREFTDEGLALKSLILTLEHDLMYRSSCAKEFSSRLNTPPIQRYIHQFIDELENDFEKVANALGDFTSVGVSAISHEQLRSSQSLLNILTVATFFSAVTATTLQMSTSAESPSPTLLAASMLWFTSLVFSVGAALNSLLAMAWNETRAGLRGGKLPFWVTMWIEGSQLIFLGISIVTFSAGLAVFAFCSGQAAYTPYITVSSTAITFIGLIAILIWMTHEKLVSPVFHQQANVIKSSGESMHSNMSKISIFSSGIAEVLSTLPFGLHAHYNGSGQQDPEKELVTNKLSEEGSPVKPSKDDDKHLQPLTKFRNNVKTLGLINTAMAGFNSAGRRHKQLLVKTKIASNARPQVTINTSVMPTTHLTLPMQPFLSVDFVRYGLIRDVVYSEDGSRLAVTCAKDNNNQSWTGIFFADARRVPPEDHLTLVPRADTWHQGRAISERLIWSSSSKKLIIKFPHRFDVWDLDANVLEIVERHHPIHDIEWCGEDTFLVAEHSCVFKMNLNRVMTVYRFEHMLVRSIALERRHGYLILVTRVMKSSEEFEPASGQSEKRIVIYDMDNQKTIYQVPVLENISDVHSIVGELDLLVTHKDHKAFQLWSLDACLKGAENGTEITARLKKRGVTPCTSSEDYIGPTCIGGNYNQFVFNAASSGVIDIWRRESGQPYQRFKPQLLQDEDLRCFSWRRSKDATATFATAGEDSHVLNVWQGEETTTTKSPTTITSPNWPNASKLSKATSWPRPHQIITNAIQCNTGPLTLSNSFSLHKSDPRGGDSSEDAVQPP